MVTLEAPGAGLEARMAPEKVLELCYQLQPESWPSHGEAHWVLTRADRLWHS